MEIKRNEKGQFERIYDIDDYFFKDIDTEEKAYALGFWCADGNVQVMENGSYRLSVTQVEQDLDILEKLKKALKYTNPSYCITEPNGNRKRKYCMNIYNRRLVSDIMRQGCPINKSLTLVFPKSVPEHLLHHFIRGYFDGDGCIWCGKPHLFTSPTTGKTKFIFNTKFTFTGSLYFIPELQEYLIKKLGFNKTKLNRSSSKPNTCTMEYSGIKQCKKLYDYMYKDATIFGKRKKAKFEEIICANREKLRLETRLIAENSLES